MQTTCPRCGTQVDAEGGRWCPNPDCHAYLLWENLDNAAAAPADPAFRHAVQPGAPADPSFPLSRHSDDSTLPPLGTERVRRELATYEERASYYTTRARRLELSIIALGVATAVVGAFTAIADEAVLGVVTGCLGALAAGLESWRSASKWQHRAQAYSAAFSRLQTELILFEGTVATTARSSISTRAITRLPRPRSCAD